MIHRIPCFQGAAEKEHSSSLAIAFLLFTLILTIFMIHAMLQVCSALTTSSCQHCDCFWSQIKFHYLPESLAIVFLGAVLGLLMTALPEAETKRVCFITFIGGWLLFFHWILYQNFRLRRFPPPCSSSFSCPQSYLSRDTISTRAISFR